MGDVERRLAAAGLILPIVAPVPNNATYPFPMVLRQGSRLLISGHGPQDPSGAFHAMQGKLGDSLGVDQGYLAARLVALAVLGSLKRELGDLDRVSRWIRVFGMVNSAPTFCDQPLVINGFSDLIISLYGDVRGAHARSSVGMAQLPFNIPVEVEAEVEIYRELDI